MAVAEDEDVDDEEEIPLSEMRKMKMEPMDIDDMPMEQRMNIKKEKLDSRLPDMRAKVKAAPEIIEIDSD